MEPFKEARADVITEFIEAAIHSILYVRGVYPAAIFKPRRKYGTTVHMCCHADINQYIIKSLKTVHSLLLEIIFKKCMVQKVGSTRRSSDLLIATIFILSIIHAILFHCDHARFQ
uniref:HORMA domain-containing protein n=1 Tax=Amphimedon queenslandica TaxID=400682 RepID=A0A1X7UQN3_AMPQE